MNSKLWIRKALSSCLVVALLATYSMVALGNTERIAGELTVAEKNVSGATPVVTVNGEAAKSGRSIFSSSTIVTPENAAAIVNIGKLGRIELAPNSSLMLNFDDKGINGQLTSGKLTVLGAAEGVNITTAAGQTVVNAGESVTASGKAQDDDAATGGGGAAWWVWAAVFGGAAAGILIAATNSDNRIALGDSGTVVSPNL